MDHQSGFGLHRCRGFVVLAGLIACSSLQAIAGNRIESAPPKRLSGIDLSGQLHRFADEADCKATVVVFLSTECPISNSYLPLLNRMASKYRRRDVEFFGVISDPHVTRSEAAKHRKEYRISFPILFDASGGLRQALAPTHTPQVFVLDRNGSSVYDGMIDDQFVDLGRRKTRVEHKYLRDALQAAIDGRKADVVHTTPVGCLLEQAANESKSGDITFARDVAPIIQANCVECHRPGQSAPFSLLTYEDVSRHARQIAVVTKSRFMPPWKPAAGYGEFRDNRRLSKRQIDLISRWVADGKPRGKLADMPPAAKPPEQGWRLGKPDLVLTMPEEFSLPPSGPDVFQHFVIPSGMSEGRLIEAVEFRPGNRRVVHHASFYLDTTGAARQLDAADSGYGYSNFGGPGFTNRGSLRNWLPGMTPRRLPKGTGRPMERQSDVVLEIHYQRSGKPEKDRSSIGLHYAARNARQVVVEILVANKALEIPAGANRHREQATFTLPVATTLLDVAPHMHLLGTEIKAKATQPDGKVVPLVWIKEWDFNWQGQYSFRKPIRLPAGTRIDVEGWYDNSKQNRLNPSTPPRRVYWGDQTIDEMLICHFQCTCDNLQDMGALNSKHFNYQRQQELDYRKAGRRK